MEYKDKFNELINKLLKDESPILRVGNGASGKTTLIESLLDEKYYKPLIFDEEKSIDELLDEGKSLKEISRIYKKRLTLNN